MEDETRNAEPISNEEIDLAALDEDDVEAHGFKEIAVGLSVAATIGGAGVGVASHALQPQAKVPGVVQQAVADTNRLADNAVRGSGAMVTESSADAIDLADSEIDRAGSLIGQTVDLASDAVTAATSTVQQQIDTAQDLTNSTYASATSTATRSASRASSATSQASTIAQRTSSSTQQTAGNLAEAAIDTTVDVVGYARSVVGGWSLDVKVLGTGAHSGGNVLAPSGTVTVKDAQGTVVASAKLANGTASVHLEGAGADATYTVDYSGDVGFAPSMAQYRVPLATT